MSGAGMASDGTSLYLLDANGTFDPTLNAQGFLANGDYGNAFLRLSTSPRLAVADYFATFDTIGQSPQDADLGSGGALVLPDLADASGAIRHLALGAGKDSIIYVVNRDAMGRFNASANLIWQEVDGQLPGGVFGMPAYYDNLVYCGAVGDNVKAFPLSAARLATPPPSHSPGAFPYPGATPSISASGATNGMVWAAENGATGGLHAFDAGDLGRELYDSTRSGARDAFGAGNKFIAPMIAHSHVYVGGTNGVAVFGLLRRIRRIVVTASCCRITASVGRSGTRVLTADPWRGVVNQRPPVRDCVRCAKVRTGTPVLSIIFLRDARDTGLADRPRDRSQLNTQRELIMTRCATGRT